MEASISRPKSNQWTLIMLLACMVFCTANAQAQVEVPPFVAKGMIKRVPTREPPGRERTFTFYYSNGWWQVEVRTVTPFHTNIVNCMKIPDGVRHYTISEGAGTSFQIPAYACPLAFPPPGGSAPLFEVWLSLCPKPELPIIDAQRMHRFFPVPTCEANVILDPRNVGDYTAHYLGPGTEFLSELTIANNGLRLDLSWPPPFKLTVQLYREPFTNGFLEFKYEVLQSMTVNGWTFPKHAVHERYEVSQTGNESPQVNTISMTEIHVQSIDFSPAAQLRRRPAPPIMLASDERTPAVPGQVIHYSVKGDQWKPVPKIRQRQSAAGEQKQ